MNLRRIAKPISAILLTVGLIGISVGPADAGTRRAPGHSINDTGWGFR